MKPHRSFWLLIVLISLNAFSQDKKKTNDYKTFDNEEFVFNYPKKWRAFKDQQTDVIVSVGPKGEIRDPFGIPGVMDSNFEYSPCKFSVYKEKFEFNSPEEYIEFRKKEKDNKTKDKPIDVEYQEKIINESHFQEIIIFKNKDSENSRHKETANLMYYYIKEKQLYILQFSTPLNEIEDYKEEAQFIFESFSFKDR